MRRDETWIFPATLIAGGTLLWAAAFAAATGFGARPNGLKSLTAALAIIALAASWRFLRFLYRMWRTDVPDPLRQMSRNLKPALASFMPILAGVVIIGIFLSSMTFLKSMIVTVVPFWADAPLAAFDEAIAVNPEGLARSFQPYIAQLGRFYGLWHAIHLGGILWVLHWRAGAKGQMIISFMLTWVIGMALAFIFSSAGPIFTGRFDPALAPESVRRVTNFLWTNYQAKGALIGGGISAFPSMHVALAAWFAIALKEKGLLWLGVAYTLAIFACSIILGWHYSLDGVAGIGIAWFADRLSARWLRAPVDSPSSSGFVTAV